MMSGDTQEVPPPRLIVALDQPDLPKATALAAELSDKVSAFKVGLTLFSAYGPTCVGEIGLHGRVFCDLKFHDIPSQVGSAAAELARLGVWMFTVHASGGASMIEAAVEGAGKGPDPTMVAAVTVLTSAPHEDSLPGTVVRLGKLAADAGAHAVVCSAHESRLLREALGDRVQLVVPGVRRAGDDYGDQARAATPDEAAAAGASYVVVGRPIAGAADPVAAAGAILEELGW